MQDESFSQMQLDILQMLDPSFLATISMQELYERIFQRKPPIIEGLLYTGTYLFVGAPKLGKSFFMAQLAYHVSTILPYGSIRCGGERCSISHLRMITGDCRSVCTGCSARNEQTSCSSPSPPIRSARDWTSSSVARISLSMT